VIIKKEQIWGFYTKKTPDKNPKEKKNQKTQNTRKKSPVKINNTKMWKSVSV